MGSLNIANNIFEINDNNFISINLSNNLIGDDGLI